MAANSDDEHTEDECRICRCGADSGALFYPCKCSGSIKFVHSQCLMDWLKHSGNEFCEVCKHKFSFTPVYASNAPATLPWHELLLGLIKRVLRGVKVAHRVWVVSCVWLIVVPWITCLAWRLAFLRGFTEVPRLVRERCNVLAVATDCIQGSLLSIGIVFLNMAVSSLKEQLRAAVNSLETQLARDTGTAAAAAGPGAAGAGAADVPAAAAVAAAAPGADGASAGAAAGAGAAAEAAARSGASHAAAEQAAAPSAASASQDVSNSNNSMHGHAAVVNPAAAAASTSSTAAAAEASADSGSSSSSRTSLAFEASAAAAAGSSSSAAAEPPQQQQQQQHEEQQRHDQAVAAAPAAAAAHDVAAADEDAAAAAAAAAADDGDGWADVPFEELLGLQGPWVNFLETIILVMIGNAFFMVGVVCLPLNIGRLLLSTLRTACQSLTPQQQLLLQQALSQQMQLPIVSDTANFILSLLMSAPGGAATAAAAVNATASAAVNATVAVAAAVVANAAAAAGGSLAAAAALTNATAAAAAAGVSSAAAAAAPVAAAALNATASAAAAIAASAATSSSAADPVVLVYPPLDAEPLPLVALSLEHVLRELQVQLELPARADFVALSLGHTLLAGLLLLGLWAYASVRLWRAASRRVRLAGRRPLLQVLQSTGRWLLSAATLLSQGFKLLLLLTIELGLFPLAAGLWLDICALPLTSTSIAQRSELLVRSPLISGLMHWVLGVGFLLGFTFLLCVVREVLRPGALPFLKDPTNPERNPVKEMLEEPLLRHLGRVVLSSLVYAGLCVVLVHLPALLAHALVPSLYPLRVALFDPLTQIPADMLLLHIFIPFTVEHVRVKGAVKAAVHCWLGLVGRLLGWGDYLLPLPEEEAGAAAAAAVQPLPAAQPVEAGVAAQQQQVVAAGAEAATAALSSTSAAAAAASGLQQSGSFEPAAADRQEQQEDDQERQPLLLPTPAAAAAAAPVQPQQQQQQQAHQQPVQWYQQQANYTMKLLGLAMAWLLTMVMLNCLLLIVPIGLGRALFKALNLPFKNDLFTGAMGLLALWGGYSLAAGVANSASVRNSRAAIAAAGRWLLLAGQCTVLLVLWLGVVATMLGMLCELVLLPLRLPPNQTALIYLYQDWTMGVLALKLWHLLVIVAPRREGRPAPDPDSWQAHFEAVQAGGLRNLDFHRALTKIVVPILLHLATCLAVPYVITRGLLPLLRLPAVVLQYANLYGYAAYHGLYVAYLASRKLHQWALQLHNTIRDDRYLVGRELNNFELQQQQQLMMMQAAVAGEKLQLQQQQQQDELQEPDQQQQQVTAVGDGGGSGSAGPSS